METTIRHEYVTDVYDELVNALRAHTDIARNQVVVNSQFKQLKEQALDEGAITGSNAGNRDAAWNVHLKDHLGIHAYWHLTGALDQKVANAKLRLDIARIKVEELRLHVRIIEGERAEPDIRYDKTGFETVYQDEIDRLNSLL